MGWDARNGDGCPARAGLQVPNGGSGGCALPYQFSVL